MKRPSFPLYVADWLSSPKITLMTPAQEGAYIRLLCYAWSDPDCSLPEDDQTLAKLSRLGEGWFNGGSSIIRECFVPHPKQPERLVNLRLLEERKKQDAWREKSRLGGVSSGRSRTSQVKGGSTTVEAEAQGVVEPKANSSSSLSSSSPPLQKGEECPPAGSDLPTVQEVVDSWNRIPGSKLIHADRLTPGRGLHKRITVLTRQQKNHAAAWWEELFRAIDAQKLFLFSGVNPKQWVADLPWILGPENLAKVQERRYEDFRVPIAGRHDNGRVPAVLGKERIPL